MDTTGSIHGASSPVPLHEVHHGCHRTRHDEEYADGEAGYRKANRLIVREDHDAHHTQRDDDQPSGNEKTSVRTVVVGRHPEPPLLVNRDLASEGSEGERNEHDQRDDHDPEVDP